MKQFLYLFTSAPGIVMWHEVQDMSFTSFEIIHPHMSKNLAKSRRKVVMEDWDLRTLVAKYESVGERMNRR